MTASQPRRKLFDSPITPTSPIHHPLLNFSLFMLIVFGTILFLIIGAPSQVASSQLFLEPELLKERSDADVVNRVPRSIIQLDFGDEKYNGHNNPSVLEGGRSAGGDARSGDDAYETLRQMSLASTQPFIKRRLFNTSVALTVPMFSFTLPQRAAEGSTVDLANQAIFGLFALLTTMLVFAVPVLFTGIRPFDVYGRSMKSSNHHDDSSQDILNNLLKNSEGYNINLMGVDTQNKIGLNPEECLKKTICDAHRHPKKYGLFALPFLIFVPPPTPGTSDSRMMSKYQMAAQTGEYTKEECWAIYNCFFDVLDLAVYVTDWFSPSGSPADNQEDLMHSKDNFV